MPQKTTSLFFILSMTLASTSGNAQDNTLTFLQKNKVIATMDLAALQSKIPPQKITVWEPHEDKDVTYEGFPVDDLLSAVYGKKWQESEEILFTCTDGYQPSLPMQRFKTYKSFLVYKRLDQKDFKVQNRYQNEKDVPLGPFYLVWDNKKSAALKALGGSGWPYQVAKLDLVSFADQFPSISPPKNASAKAKAGFLAFRDHCLPCHTINGEGGNKAAELNYPTNVTEYFSDKWIKTWTTKPASIRFNTTMPSFASLPKHDETIDQIIAYLKAMKGHKVQPKPK